MTHVTADYILMKNGQIKVINRGIKEGKPKEIIGKAKQPDPIQYPGRLKVSFFLWFYADYYILDLDDNYRYAVIGSSSDKYLWILSRTPQMDTCLYNKILRGIERRGYDLSRLVFVKQ
jgi:lipocalin